MKCLGIDTSNYTTSAALYDTVTGEVFQKRRLLKVKPGEIGLRQSDAVFQHTVALPEILKELYEEKNTVPDVIGVSVSPRDEEGSYMPCFMTGKGAADSLGTVFGVPVKYFSHQAGHIAAAIYSAGKLGMKDEEFLAFHVSGGTTEAVRVMPDKEKVFSVELAASSLDLKAGQAVDRTGAILGLPFPAGPELDKLARESRRQFRLHPFMKDGSCSLSGIENKCRQMKEAGEPDCDIARFCIEYIRAALSLMTDALIEKYPGRPLVYSGGVMSNSLIRESFAEKYNAVFAQNGFSSDNAVGIAVLAGCVAE